MYLPMALSPNPVKESLNRSFKMENAMDNLILTHDIKGKLIYKEKTGLISNYNQSIPVGHLVSGAYMITLTNTKGSRTMEFVKLFPWLLNVV